MSDETVNHPSHYGGKDNTYEAIKVIEAHNLGFHLGNALKYILRAGKKPGVSPIEDLKKAQWYIDRFIQLISPPSSPEKSEPEVLAYLIPMGGYTPVGPFKVEYIPMGEYRISDSKDSRIATCYLLENANFVKNALNEYHENHQREGEAPQG